DVGVPPGRAAPGRAPRDRPDGGSRPRPRSDRAALQSSFDGRPRRDGDDRGPLTHRILYPRSIVCGRASPLRLNLGVHRMAAKKQRVRKKPPRRPKTFDMALIRRAARVRRSPFFESTLPAGSKSYTVYNHTFLPIYYDDPVREYWHLLENVALWDVAVERNVEIAGPDGFEFMQLLTPRDMRSCRVGQGEYVLIVAEAGGILNDPALLPVDENDAWTGL